MSAPSLMTEHGLTPRKGWFQPAALDYDAPLAAAVEYDLPSGRAVHLNADGEFEPGVGQTDMAIFLFPGSDHYDVANPGITARGNFMHRAIAPTGKLSGLVATGAYELETTEFNDELEYVPNDLLRAPTGNDAGAAATGGVLTNERSAGLPVRQYAEAVCGCVSGGKRNNEHGIPVLAFWPVFLPGAFA